MYCKRKIFINAGSYYQDLARNFRSNNLELRYEEDDHIGKKFFGFSKHIDSLCDINDVSRRLYSLQVLLNGTIRTQYEYIQDFKWEEIKSKLDKKNSKQYNKTKMSSITFGIDGKNGVFSDSIEECPFELCSKTDKDEYESVLEYSDKLSLIFDLSKHDKNLRILLFQIGMVSTNTAEEKILSWSVLYKILESIKFYSNKYKCHSNCFKLQQQKIINFKAACNNMSILGLNARHGASNNAPPKIEKVITDLDESIELIFSLSKCFIESYINSVHFKKLNCSLKTTKLSNCR